MLAILLFASTPALHLVLPRPVAPHAAFGRHLSTSRRPLPPMCSLQPPQGESESRPKWWLWQQLHKRWHSIVGAAAIGSTSAFCAFSCDASAAFAAAPAPRAGTSTTYKKTKFKTKKVKKSNGNSALGTMVMIGGVSFWAYTSAKDEDAEEQKRIKVETEKMDKLAKEFTDIDEQVTTDEDMLASLKERMSNSTSAKEGTEGDDIRGAQASDMPPPMDSNGGAAVVEPPLPEPEDEPPALASDADVDMLKKMFGSDDN